MLNTRTPEQWTTGVFTLCALVLALGYGSGLLSGLAPTWLLVSAIFVLGMPHGALDLYLAQHALALRDWPRWCRFLLAYSALAVGIYACWQVWPSVSLVTFLVISAYHFADDLAADTPSPLKLLHGLQVVTLPAVWHADSLYALYQVVSHSHQIADIIIVSQHLAGLAVGAGGLFLVYLHTVQRTHVALSTWLEWGATMLLMLFTPPLLAFTVYFCLLHSPRHLLRTAVFLRDSPSLFYRWPVILACLCVAIAGGGMLYQLSGFTLDQSLIAVIFPLLAALTYPHVLLLQWAQFSRQWTPRPLLPLSPR